MNFIKELYISFTNLLVSFRAPTECNDVLILRLDELGDFILWLDSAKEYRKIFPSKNITLLVNEKWESLAKTFPYWNEVIGINTNNFRFNPFYRLEWLRFIRNQNYEITLCPRFFIQSLLEPAIMAICGSEQKIVYGGNFPREKSDCWTKWIEPREGTVHELIRNADFIRQLGVKDFKARTPKLVANKNKDMKYVVLCPTAFRKNKEWGLNKFIEIAMRIWMKKDSFRVVFCSNKEIGLPSFFINSTGKTDLLNLIDCIANASLVVANDSGPIHLAVALGVPSVCVGIGKHGKMFHPYVVEEWRGNEVFPKVIWNQDVKSISVDEVWNIVKETI